MSSHLPADTLHYENFDLRIHNPVDGQYPIEVIDSPVGEMARPLLKPFSHLQTFNFRFYLASLGRTDLKLKARHASRFSKLLGNMLFPDKVWNMFYASLTKQISRGQGLRIRLRIDPFELSRLPWEYCYREPFAYLALSRETPLVRYINQPLAAPSLASPAPLRLLVVIASPFNFAPLDVEAEKKRITEALQGQEEQIQVQFLEQATVQRMQQALIQYRPHVLHFIGHGLIEQKVGYLVLENERHQAHLVDAEQLATLLQGRGIKIVVLNACQTADFGKADMAIMGVGPALVRANIPAVIAMQFPIPDSTAILFTRQLYASLAQGQALDTAITEMRIATYTQGNDKIHWGIPVLFMRSPDGIIRPASPAEEIEKEEPKAEERPVSALNISDVSGSTISINIGGDFSGGSIQK